MLAAPETFIIVIIIISRSSSITIKTVFLWKSWIDTFLLLFENKS